MASFDAIADLPLEIESCEFEGLEISLGEFERLTTIVKFSGGGEEGIGEDVVYDAVDHVAQQGHGPPEGLAFSGTFAEFSEHLDGDRPLPGRRRRSARSPRATTAAGPSSRRRWTWRCARPGPTSPRRSGASRGR